MPGEEVESKVSISDSCDAEVIKAKPEQEVEETRELYKVDDNSENPCFSVWKYKRHTIYGVKSKYTNYDIWYTRSLGVLSASTKQGVIRKIKMYYESKQDKKQRAYRQIVKQLEQSLSALVTNAVSVLDDTREDLELIAKLALENNLKRADRVSIFELIEVVEDLATELSEIGGDDK